MQRPTTSAPAMRRVPEHTRQRIMPEPMPSACLGGLRKRRLAVITHNATEVGTLRPTAQRCHMRKRDGLRMQSVQAQALPGTQTLQPDLILEAADMLRRVQVFGLSHTCNGPAIAEHILRTRPSVVLVETAVTPEHGARPGNTLSCRDRMIEGPAAFFLRMFCQVAAMLTEQAAESDVEIAATPLWREVTNTGPYRAEQLVYIATLACGIPLVFGDRPKDITYRRLFTLPSCAQLDEGFGLQAAANYLGMLGQAPPSAPSLEAATMVERITMQEREAIMCSVAHDAASTQAQAVLEGADGSRAAAVAVQGDGEVVMVVGSAHLAGIEQLWSGARWRELLGCSHTLDSSLLLSPPLSVVPDREVGLRRGLLHALLRMSATREVLEDVEQTLGPVPALQRQAFEAVSEVYGSTRTMLACLDRDLLARVCQGLRDEQGVQQDFWEVLEPVRAIRPVNGGPAYSEEMVMYLRALNFELE